MNGLTSDGGYLMNIIGKNLFMRSLVRFYQQGFIITFLYMISECKWTRYQYLSKMCYISFSHYGPDLDKAPTNGE